MHCVSSQRTSVLLAENDYNRCLDTKKSIQVTYLPSIPYLLGSISLLQRGQLFMVQIRQDMAFATTDLDDTLTADIYMPSTSQSYPLILLLHEGGWRAGSKDLLREWGVLLAESGFVAAALNYRHSTGSYATWPGVLDDVRQGLYWLVLHARNFQFDPQRIGLFGASAGAHLAAMLVLTYYAHYQPPIDITIRAMVGAYGIYSLIQPPDIPISQAIEDLIGIPYGHAPQLYRQASPMIYVNRAAENPRFRCGFLLIWGSSDMTVPPSNSELFAQRLEMAGLDVRTLVIPDANHSWLMPFPPGVRGGTLHDYPNTVVVPEVLTFLRAKL